MIQSLEDLEQAIGQTPPAIQLKVIDHLDSCAIEWIGHSPFLFACFSGGGTIAVTLAGGEPGFVMAESHELRLPVEAIDNPSLAVPGFGFGSLFLIPAVGEGLRVNGRVKSVDADTVVISVEECYLHCAKALIRSEFWSTLPQNQGQQSTEEFIAASRFVALATSDAYGKSDLSPKGDPAGSMARLSGDALWFADRPGNRKIDSFRNIVSQPTVAAALLVPGSHKVCLVHGTAKLCADEEARRAFAVEGRIPQLVTGIEKAELEVVESRAIPRSALWLARERPAGIDAASIFSAHMKLNRNKGIAARIASTVVSVPGLMRKGLERDYKSNLY